jgi:uncharacterized membrane protein
VRHELAPLLLIVAMAAATYATRLGGYLMLARMGQLNPRVEAGLDAVPAAVMTAIVAPIAVSGFAEGLASLIMAAASLRLPLHTALVIGVGAVVALRLMGL